MAVLIVLGVALVLAHVAGAMGIKPLDSWPAAAPVGLAAMLLFTSVAHFNSLRHDLARMIPPGVPSPMGMAWWSGIARARWRGGECVTWPAEGGPIASARS